MSIWKKQFTIHNESWYANWMSPLHDAIEEIVVGRYAYENSGDSAGCEFEFVIRFYKLQQEVHPHIEMFEDSWQAFTHPLFKELFIMLAETKNCHSRTLTKVKQTIINILLECGFEDNTNRTKN